MINHFEPVIDEDGEHEVDLRQAEEMTKNDALEAMTSLYLEMKASESGQTVEEYLKDPELRFQGGYDFFSKLVEELSKTDFLKDPEKAKANVEIMFAPRLRSNGEKIATGTMGFSARRSAFEQSLEYIAQTLTAPFEFVEVEDIDG